MKKTNSKMILPATDPHGAEMVNIGLRNAENLLNRFKVLDSERGGDKRAARFAGKMSKVNRLGKWRCRIEIQTVTSKSGIVYNKHTE